MTDHEMTRCRMHENAWRIAATHVPRAASTAAAIRACQARALEIAVEADMDGRPGIARALRRKVMTPRSGDVQVEHLAGVIRVRIAAYGVAAQVSRETSAAMPS